MSPYPSQCLIFLKFQTELQQKKNESTLVPTDYEISMIEHDTPQQLISTAECVNMTVVEGSCSLNLNNIHVQLSITTSNKNTMLF